MEYSWVAVVVFFCCLKIWLKYVVAWDRTHTCLVGKTIIITGANTGLGFYAALEFAKRGARVILGCRNKEKAEKARNKIIEATGNQNIIVKIIDCSSLKSVREFAAEINSTEERLDILVNNAGAVGAENVLTKDGLNPYMQINHFSGFLLTNLLIGLLKKSAPSRILQITSISAHWARLDINSLNDFKDVPTTYANTKLCNILFSNELTRRLKGSGVDANSVHPGQVQSSIGRNLPILDKFVFDFLTHTLFRSTLEGVQTILYAALSKELEGVSGEYFDNCAIGWLPGMPKIARDEDLAKQLWEKSEEFVKLTPEERQI